MPVEPTCCAGPNELLRGILIGVNEIAESGGGGGGGGGNVNLTQIVGTAASVGCGTSDAGTLRVAQASNCAFPLPTGASTAALQTQPGVDIGDVTVNNGAAAAAVNIQDGGNSITVDGTVTIGTSVTPGTAAANLGKAEDSAHTSGDVGVMALSVANEAQANLAADNDYTVHASDIKGNSLTVGNLAHDAVDAGFPLKIGGQARTTNPAAVVDADRVNAIFDKLGKQVVVGSIRILKARQVTIITASTAETTIVTAGGAGVFKDLYSLILTNTSVTATEVTIRDATAGGTISSFMVPAGATVGFTLPESGAWPQGTAANNWTATSSASITSLKVTALTVENL